MRSRQELPFQKIDMWYGVNTKDSNENMLSGELHEDSINVYSSPRGGIGSRTGYSGITTASIGTAVAFTGGIQYKKGSNSYIVAGASNGKVYKFEAAAYSSILDSSWVLASGVNSRWSFDQLNNILVGVDGTNTIKWTGSGTAVTLGGTLVTADFGLEWQNYYWLHSVVDKRLMFYCTTPYDPESGFTSFLNFDTDPGNITGACKQGDDMLVGKENTMNRVQYTGSEPKFTKYRFGKVGPVSFWSMKEVETGVVMFLGTDYQVYLIKGDEFIEIGDNVKEIISESVKSRLQYAVAGVNRARKQFHLSLTIDASSTGNDRLLVCDYTRPYQDKWGKLQFPWFIFEYDDNPNCFFEVDSQGSSLLYHGGYKGKIYRDDIGTNDDGVAFRNYYRSKKFTESAVVLEKKYTKLFLDFQNKGNHNLTITAVLDNNASTEKVITQSMNTGAGASSLWDVMFWDIDNWAGDTNSDIGRDIDRIGKGIYFTMGNDGLDEEWNMYSYTYMMKPLRMGTSRTRENT